MGGSSPSPVRRRLAAILAADVVGYSSRMGQDEEGTLALVRYLRRDILQPRIEAHQGRIFKAVGDGFLAEFSSPVEAVRCALEVQAALAEGASSTATQSVQLRIGINLGDIIVEEDGDVFGDGVNVAARLEQLAEPGGICVSGAVHDQIDGKIPALFENKGEQLVKNIAKPVRVYASRSAATVGSVQGSAHPILPDKPSIAVLPFTNMSGDPEQEYFADGVVEDIITALSHVPRLFVVARNSSFTYKGRAVDVRQVGRELGVRYVLEGSVRRSGQRIRITGQLIDTADGSHLWSDRFDGEVADVFDLQDHVTATVAGAIAPRLIEVEVERAFRRRPDDLAAYDLYLRALREVRQITRQANDAALDLIERALRLDPDYAVAAALGAWTYTIRAAQNWRVDADEERRRALELCRLALSKGQDDADTLAMAGYTIGFLGERLSEGILAVDRAIRLNPNSALAHTNAGWLRTYLGQAEAAVGHLMLSIRLSPRDPSLFRTYAALAFAKLLQEQFDEAAEWGQQSTISNPNFAPGLRALASALANGGRQKEASEAAARLIAVSPDETVTEFSRYSLLRYSGGLEPILSGLRKAGVPG